MEGKESRGGEGRGRRERRDQRSEGNEGKILEHAISLLSWVSFVQEFEKLRVLLPLSDFQRFAHRLSINPREPQLICIVVYITCLFFRLPHFASWGEAAGVLVVSQVVL